MSLRERATELGGPFPRRVSALDRVAGRVRRPLDRRALQALAPLDQVRRLGGAVRAAAEPMTGPRVLVLALRGWPNHCALETTIAQALRLRGADVALLTCGGGQPACEMGWGREAYPRPCDRCAWYTDEAVAASGLRGFRLVDGFDWGADGRRAPERPLPSTVDPDWAGQVSVPWFLKATHTENVPDAPQAWRDYAIAASAVEASATAVLDAVRARTSCSRSTGYSARSGWSATSRSPAVSPLRPTRWDRAATRSSSPPTNPPATTTRRSCGPRSATGR